jgi:hypothetical protein
MSALAPKADIRQRGLDVRYVPKADIVRTSRRQKGKGDGKCRPLRLSRPFRHNGDQPPAPERLMFEAFGAIGRVPILTALACVPCRMTRGTCAHRLQHDVGVPPA